MIYSVYFGGQLIKNLDAGPALGLKTIISIILIVVLLLQNILYSINYYKYVLTTMVNSAII